MDIAEPDAHGTRRPGKPLQLRARLASIGILALGGLQVLFGMFLASIPTQDEVAEMSDSEYDALQARMEWLGNEALLTLVELGLKMTAGVLFWMWMYRAYQNLTALERAPEHDAARAVWCWFVPLANLVLPYQMMAEIWRKSGAHIDDLEADSTEWNSGPPTLVALWWGTWLLERVTGTIAGRSESTLTFYAIDVMLVCVSGALAIAMVHEVTRRQEAALQRGRVGAPMTF